MKGHELILFINSHFVHEPGLAHERPRTQNIQKPDS